MKAILAGVHISNFLSIRALIGKFVGVTLSIIGGLSFGRYGAFVHMCSVIAHQLAYRIRWFRNVLENYLVKNSMYIAAVAVGTCCAAGCPLGGVMFALEQTTTFFMVDNIWKSMICTTVAIIIYQYLHFFLPFVKPP